MGSAERYEKLGLGDSLCQMNDYPSACYELSFILRRGYSNLPKNAQALVYRDTLAAFRILPQVPTRRGISAANLLLQAAEAALPKQKRGLAVTEFKHAVVAHKRRCKSQQNQQGSSSLPHDVLVHIFSFLDMRSLAAVGVVCWSWSSAASDNILWQTQFNLFFGDFDICESTEQVAKRRGKRDMNLCENKDSIDLVASFDWRDAFKRKYKGNSLWRSTSNRGYCGHCNSIIWLSDLNRLNLHHGLKDEKKRWKIKPLSPHQVVAYVLGDSPTWSSSDSDSDSDGAALAEQRLPKLWAYTRHMRRDERSLPLPS